MLPKPLIALGNPLSDEIQSSFLSLFLQKTECEATANWNNFFNQWHTTSESSGPSDEASAENYLCPDCPNTFRTKQGLHQHLGKVHRRKAKTAFCEECGKSFAHKHALKYHVRQVHEKATRCECPSCGKSLYNKYELRKHMAKRHDS